MNRAIVMVLLGLAAVATPASAGEIYKTTDEDGNVVYTDEPPSEDAEPVDLEPLTTVPAPEEPAAAAGEGTEDNGPDSGAAAHPEGMRIAYPPNDEAIRHNGGNVPFRVRLEPQRAQLPPGYRIQIVLDGEVRDTGTGAEIVVSPVNRGPHTAHARLVDADGEPRLASEPVDFYLLRATIGNEPDRGLQQQQQREAANGP